MSSFLIARSDVSEFRKRYGWIAFFTVIALGIVITRLFQLQVLDYESYAQIAHENIVKRVTIPTTRGVIRDAHGRILASSRASFNALVVPGRVMPSARPRRVSQAGLRTREESDSWNQIADILRLNPDERSRFAARIRTACASDEDRSPCWRPIVIREDLTRDIVAEVKQHVSELPGIEIVSQPVRYYPYKAIAAHSIGYTSEIDAETLSKFRPENWQSMTPAERQQANPLGYEPGDVSGSTGVERAWESYLRGQRGWEKRLVDARGRYRTGQDAERLLDTPKRQDPLGGRDLRLTLDIDLVQAIDRAMRPHAAGAAVVVDVRTGRLLAMYSKPTFDPNDLSGGAGRDRIRESFNKLYADPLRPMLDKTTSGAFQPGSTFKPFSALAALEDKLIKPSDRETCGGYVSYGRRLFRCTHTHGRVDMREAIAESCNVYFFRLAESVGMDRIAKVASEFGLGEKTGIGVNPESAGRIPTRGWYALKYKGQFRLGFTLNTAIGQGDTTVTPLQLALAYAAIANGGTVYSPQIVQSVETSGGLVVQDFPPRVRQKAGVSQTNLARIADALGAVVNDKKGTAYPVRDPELDIAGKTGTAQTGYINSQGDDPHKAFLAKDHAWFAAYYPAKTPEIAVVVLVEHGGYGPTVAAPIAVQVIRDYRRLALARQKLGTKAATDSKTADPTTPAQPARSMQSAPDGEADIFDLNTGDDSAPILAPEQTDGPQPSAPPPAPSTPSESSTDPP